MSGKPHVRASLSKPPDPLSKTKRFKVGLFKHAPSFSFPNPGYYTETVASEREAQLNETFDSFERWLTDWIEYEVEA